MRPKAARIRPGSTRDSAIAAPSVGFPFSLPPPRDRRVRGTRITRRGGTMTQSELAHPAGTGARQSLRWRTRDFVVIAALAVPLGLIWSYVWGVVWLTGRGILPELGYVLDGFYVIA